MLVALVIFRIVRLNSVVQRWHQIPPLSLGFVIILLGLAIWARAARFAELLGIPAMSLWNPAAGYSLACLVLPGGIGEFTLPMYLKPFGITAAEGITVAVITRLADVAISAVLVVLLFPMLHQVPGTILVWAAASAAGLTLTLAVLLWHPRRPTKPQILVHRALHRWHWIGRYIEPALTMLSRVSKKTSVRIILLTMAWKLLNAMMYWEFAEALSLGIRFIQICNAMLIYSLLLVLPLPSLAGFGASEAWWILSFRAEGIKLSHAVVAALTFHVGNLFAVTVLGILPMIRTFLRFSH